MDSSNNLTEMHFKVAYSLIFTGLVLLDLLVKQKTATRVCSGKLIPCAYSYRKNRLIFSKKVIIQVVAILIGLFCLRVND